MKTNRIFGRSNLGGMGWRATASSHPGRFQTRKNASPESLSRGAILEHRLGGTHNPEAVANNARDKKAAMDYLAHAQAAMDARD
jgi:hypothetical protein